MLYGVETAATGRQISEPPASYTASAVHFAGGAQGNGPTWLVIPSLTATNNSKYSFSMWVKGLCNALNAGAPLIVHDVPGAYTPWIQPSNASGHQGDLDIQFVPGAGQFKGRVLQSLLTPSVWHHLLFSADFTTGSPAFALYVDRAHISYSSTINVGSFFNFGTPSYPINLTYNAVDFFFADDSGGSGPDFDVADVWIAPGVSLLSAGAIPSSTLNLFIDTFQRPVDPAGFPASAVLFKGNAAGFATNHGTGGAATLTGTLTNASTHP